MKCIWLIATPWTVAHQAPLAMGCSRQEYWSCHFLLQGIFPTQGSNLRLLHWQVGYLPLSYLGSPSVYSSNAASHFFHCALSLGTGLGALMLSENLLAMHTLKPHVQSVCARPQGGPDGDPEDTPPGSGWVSWLSAAALQLLCLPDPCSWETYLTSFCLGLSCPC